jgi:hypothetical protein
MVRIRGKSPNGETDRVLDCWVEDETISVHIHSLDSVSNGWEIRIMDQTLLAHLCRMVGGREQRAALETMVDGEAVQT